MLEPAREALQSGRWADAIHHYERTVDDLPPVFRAQVFDELGHAYQRLRRFPEALATYSRSLSELGLQSFDRRRVHCKRAAVYMECEQFAAVVAETARALALGPNDTTALRLRREALSALGQDSLALRCARRVIELEPDDGHDRAVAAVILQEMGSGAVAEIAGAIELSTDAEEIERLIALQSTWAQRKDAERKAPPPPPPPLPPSPVLR